MGFDLVKLDCRCQQYEWGKVGSASLAARCAEASPSFTIDASKPYAETRQLWMGTHPSAPSRDAAHGELLSTILASNPALAAGSVSSTGELPFLFKILSIRKALSIQAHPDRHLAQQLHRSDPSNYKDDNHKPEMTIALTPFRGLCGFRKVGEIAEFIRTVPPLAALLGPEEVAKFRAAVDAGTDAAASLPPLFAAVMKAPADTVTQQARELVKLAASAHGAEAELMALVTVLNAQFPLDIGLFCLFLLNVVHLAPGEAMYLQANEPHAYVEGDVVECMAASDNVVRAGFTPKFKDVDNLVTMLTYETSSPEAKKMQPTAFARASGHGSCVCFDPPIREFTVIKSDVPAGGTQTIEGIHGPSIAITTAGSGYAEAGEEASETLELGTVLFVAADKAMTLANTSTRDTLTVYRAFVEGYE